MTGYQRNNTQKQTGDQQITFENLSEGLDIIYQRVDWIAENLGSYKSLNRAFVSNIPSSKSNAISSLRYTCLSVNLVGCASLFASPKRKTDLGFRSFYDALNCAGFRSHCLELCGKWFEADCSDLNKRNSEIMSAKQRKFLRLFELAEPHYQAVKQMRDRHYAHVTTASFKAPVVDNVLKLSICSMQLSDTLAFIFEGNSRNTFRNAVRHKRSIEGLFSDGSHLH